MSSGKKIMLRVQSLSKSYGAEPVLHDVSFSLSDGDCAGLVGPNGSGKSTLLRLIAGHISPDAGNVWIDPADRVAYLPQYPLDELGLSIREGLLRDNPVGALQKRLTTLQASLSQTSDESLGSLLVDYSTAQDAYERLGGYEIEARIEEVIDGLGLTAESLDDPVATLSGGNKTKLSLGRLLLSGATILLLDEPTNYLDLRSLLWLERFVVETNRTYLIVSHDRRFLDRTVDSILELDGQTHAVREWPGNYSSYAEGLLVERRKQLEAYADQQAEIKRIEEDIRRTKEQARGVERTTRSGMGADVQRRLAKKVAKKAKARERRLERSLETERIEKPRRSWGLHLADLGRSAIDDDRLILEIEGLRAGYGNTHVLRGVDLLVRGRDRVALLGGNGSGKTTLLRCCTGAMGYEGSIRLGPSVRPGYLSQETDEMPLDHTVLAIFRDRTTMHEDEARTYLHRFLFAGDAVLQPVRSLSYGQRAKLALAVLILSDANFLILDEPTSHMDMPALEAIEDTLAQYHGPFLVVSHDRYFLERVGVTRIEVMEDGTLRAVESVHEYEREITSTDALEARSSPD
jgi:ATP-binding cassette subfamily F protein 3